MDGMNNYKELKKHCDIFAKGFEDIKYLAWNWVQAKKSITKMMDAIERSGQDQIATEYEKQNSYLYMIAEVFQDPKTMKALLRKHESEITPAGYQVLSFWAKKPSFWCFFSVKEHLSDSFYIIVDHLTGKEHTLYSQGIASTQDIENAENMHFLCMMQPNGECLQTVGIIKFTFITGPDFLFYCSLFAPEEGLKAILHKHFIEFFKIDAIADVLPLTMGEYEMGFIWHTFTLPEFDIAKLGGEWLETTSDHYQSNFLKATDITMQGLPNLTAFTTNPTAMGGLIIKDTMTDEMVISANTEAGYGFFAALVNRFYPKLKLPEKPSLFITAPLHSFLASGNLPLPWDRFEQVINFRNPEEEDVAEDNTQESDTLPEDDLVDGENLLEEEDQVDYDDFDLNDEDLYFIVSEEDKVFEMKQWPKPAERYGSVLYHSLATSEYFMIKHQQEALRLFVQLSSEDFDQEIKRDGLLDYIEGLFDEEFEPAFTYPLMNTFFWLLLHMGREWVPVRSYALEIMKWIPAKTIRYFVDENEFVETFSKFTKRLLCTRGICSLAKRPSAEEVTKGTYTIKGTDAFFSLLKARDFYE